ncbi:MAG: hypothetical protein HYZ26_01925 [Chloroflexi bacterium]|nr:hypothetical protein [Chloroflexota bacterium]
MNISVVLSGALIVITMLAGLAGYYDRRKRKLSLLSLFLGGFLISLFNYDSNQSFVILRALEYGVIGTITGLIFVFAGTATFAALKWQVPVISGPRNFIRSVLQRIRREK